MNIGIKLQTHNTVKLVQPKKLSQIFLHSSSKILRNLDLKKTMYKLQNYFTTLTYYTL